MSQRTPSLAIVPPLSGINNSSSKIPLLSQDALKSLNGRSPTLNTPSDVVKINPDELFTRNTILEIRGVQANLRADAEAKREELRLMVGSVHPLLLATEASKSALKG
ncbi:hypothetical protein AX16_000395 [Volvariella volvacea WC 439]|nr:hypothetical protein AX16_000395 [Volvariella volvacea WC 439]